jgi:peptide subunit release factor 1 (eRF1)
MLEDEIRRLVRTVAAEDEVALLERFKELRGQGQRAAEGVGPTIAALEAAMVDTLLLHDRLDDERRGWFGPEANLIATDQGDLAAMGVEAPAEGRLLDLAVRAALGTGATCRLVPSTAVRDGLGAILRA